MSETDDRSELLTHLRQFAERIDDVKHACTDEAKTEQYLIEPFFQVLGYDNHDPQHVVKRLTADVAGRRGEKVDYALMRDSEPVVLVEAKGLGNKLGKGELEQLQRYFPFTPARLAVLTDGVRWNWYRGRSELDQSHQMESSPFLTYDVREPSETAAEWLTQVTKDGFNPDELLRISRRNEFTDRISDWIDRTLANPSDATAVELGKVVGLEASSQETQIVVGAIRSAWTRVLVGGLDRRGQEEMEYDVGGLADEPVNALDSHQPISVDDQSPTSAMSGDTPELRFDTHWDDRLDLGNGKVLDANKRPRAWRMGDGDWVEEKNGMETTAAVLGELLRCDWKRWDESGVALSLGLHYSDTKPENHDFRPVPGFPNIYCYMNINNDQKSEKLAEVVSYTEFDPPPEHPLAKVPRIEWWLPNKPKR